jgi:hypothetical protein
LLTVEPEIASQAFGWDPSTVTKGHGGRKEWRCKLGHAYSAPGPQRTNNRTGCPICAGRTVLAWLQRYRHTFSGNTRELTAGNKLPEQLAAIRSFAGNVKRAIAGWR